MTISNYELLDLANTYKIPNFKVLMNDEILEEPFHTKGSHYYVINLEDESEGGSHWTAIIVRNGLCLYWDSFGCVPSLQVEKFLHQSKKPYLFNNKIVQDLESVLCGKFALGCIIYINKQPTGDFYELGDKYTSLFNNKTKLNDKIILKLYTL